jgi:hypothetical protein
MMFDFFIHPTDKDVILMVTLKKIKHLRPLIEIAKYGLKLNSSFCIWLNLFILKPALHIIMANDRISSAIK